MRMTADKNVHMRTFALFPPLRPQEKTGKKVARYYDIYTLLRDMLSKIHFYLLLLCTCPKRDIYFSTQRRNVSVVVFVVQLLFPPKSCIRGA